MNVDPKLFVRAAEQTINKTPTSEGRDFARQMVQFPLYIQMVNLYTDIALGYGNRVRSETDADTPVVLRADHIMGLSGMAFCQGLMLGIEYGRIEAEEKAKNQRNATQP